MAVSVVILAQAAADFHGQVDNAIDRDDACDLETADSAESGGGDAAALGTDRLAAELAGGYRS
jgi:predicted carbohydrate-binding protein with CBM5 and CBM33 domain